MRKWSKGKKSFRFGVPVIWREPKNHSDNCYFCCCDVKGYDINIRKLSCTRIFFQLYGLLFMAQRYVCLSQQKYLKDAPTNSTDSGGDDEEFQCHTESQSPHLFTQSELNDIIIDLGLSKEKTELLGSRLKAGTSM
jgi:hypothetical protein